MMRRTMDCCIAANRSMHRKSTLWGKNSRTLLSDPVLPYAPTSWQCARRRALGHFRPPTFLGESPLFGHPIIPPLP
jgi:hypothetical protein